MAFSNLPEHHFSCFFQKSGQNSGNSQRLADSHNVDERNPAPVGRWCLLFSHYLQGFVHPRWLFRISSINSITVFRF